MKQHNFSRNPQSLLSAAVNKKQVLLPQNGFPDIGHLLSLVLKFLKFSKILPDERTGRLTNRQSDMWVIRVLDMFIYADSFTLLPKRTDDIIKSNLSAKTAKEIKPHVNVRHYCDNVLISGF